uniref:hypothetical protein n=1 Tax=Nonomuraea pusilla TaxID=46177 RepID=UPI000AB65E44|nr:hypothetical protein [Nonomuraea pusilla]
MRRLVLAWAATAVAATAAAVAVLGPIGTGVTGGPGRVLEPAEVRAALATARSAAVGGQASPLPTAPPATASEDAQARPATSPEPDAAVSTAPGEDDSVALVRSPGGTVVASCEGDLVTLRSWSPAQGYSVDGVEPGPTRQARVEFEPDEGHDVELRITCVAGRPLAVRH